MVELFQRADDLVTPIYLALWERFGVDEAMIQSELAKSLQKIEEKYSGL